MRVEGWQAANKLFLLQVSAEARVGTGCTEATVDRQSRDRERVLEEFSNGHTVIEWCLIMVL